MKELKDPLVGCRLRRFCTLKLKLVLLSKRIMSGGRDGAGDGGSGNGRGLVQIGFNVFIRSKDFRGNTSCLH